MGVYGTYIFYALIFTTVILLVEGTFFFIRNHLPSNRSANYRMKMIEKTGDDSIGLTLLKEQARKRSNIHLLEKVDNVLLAANLRISAIGFVFICLFITITIFSLTTIMGLGSFRRILFSIIGGIILPILIVSRKAQKRRDLFANQLVPAIDLVSRGLQAGHPAAVALEIVSQEMPDPIGSEFGMAIDEINYGLDRNTALSNMASRFPNGDLKFFVSALEIQRETGGNLVEVLNNLSEVMRTRRGMKKKIQAMSSEGKFTMRVVGALPLLVAGVIVLMIPDYYSKHYGKTAFTIGMAIPFFFYVVGILWIRKMINIRI